MRRLPVAVLVSAVSALAVTSLAAGGHVAKKSTRTFRAVLTTKQEVHHPRYTNATTHGVFFGVLKGKQLTWSIHFSVSTAPFLANIYSGPPHKTGPMLVELCGAKDIAPEQGGCNIPGAEGPVMEGVSTGLVRLTKAQIGQMSAGKTYLNVLTPANPKGELRGQIKRHG